MVILRSPESKECWLPGIVAQALNLPQPAGFLVTSVAKDSLAERMRLAGGQLDVVIDDERLFIGGDISWGLMESWSLPIDALTALSFRALPTLSLERSCVSN